MRFFSGNLVRVAAFVPVLGYLIIFNDGIAQYLTFHRIAPSDPDISFFLASETRLRLIYFGLISLGLAELLYILRRPHVIKLGRDFLDYKEKYSSLLHQVFS
jgi:hypothetical protein